MPFQPLFVSGPWVLPTRLPCSPFSGFLGLCLRWINCALSGHIHSISQLGQIASLRSNSKFLGIIWWPPLGRLPTLRPFSCVCVCVRIGGFGCGRHYSWDPPSIGFREVRDGKKPERCQLEAASISTSSSRLLFCLLLRLSSMYSHSIS